MATYTTKPPNFNWSYFEWNHTYAFDNFESYETFMTLPGVKYTFITLYIIIVLLSLIGNGLVIYSVARVKTLQTVRNFFILNLAVTDILMSMLASSLTPLSFYLQSWILGQFFCTLLPICLCAFVHVSSFSCAAIASHRYLQIVMPSRSQMTKRACLVTIVVIWIISIGVGMPPGVYAEVWTAGEYSFCVENWPSFDDRKAYTLIDLFIQFAVPCAFMIFFYVRIWQSLNLYGSSVAIYTQMEEGDERQVRQTNVMLVMMVVVFVICWLPINILFLLFEFYPQFLFSKVVDALYFITHVMALSSTVWYPIIYAGMDTGFRKEFKRILYCCLTKAGVRSGPSVRYTSEPEITDTDVIQYVSEGDAVEISPQADKQGES